MLEGEEELIDARWVALVGSGWIRCSRSAPAGNSLRAVELLFLLGAQVRILYFQFKDQGSGKRTFQF